MYGWVQSEGRMPYKKKGCFYYNRVEGTAFESLIPKGKGHHKALCNIPNKRHVSYPRLNEVRDELRELFRKLYRITAAVRDDLDEDRCKTDKRGTDCSWRAERR